MIVLMSVWPVLRSLPASGEPVSCASSSSAGHVGAQVRRGVGVRQALADGRVGVDHARRNRRVVRLEALLERGQRLMGRRLRQEDFGAAAPDEHDAIEPLLGLEPADVVDELFGQILFRPALLDVRAVEPLDVLPVEHGGPRLDRGELVLDLIEDRRLEHAGRARGFVAVVLEDVPAAEDQAVEAGQRHEFANCGRARPRCAYPAARCPSASASRWASPDLFGSP